jgi:acetyltransferase-like isoleucine patch superfamily enzyme
MGALRTAVGTALHLLAKQVPANGVRVKCHRARGVRIGQGVFLGYDVNVDLVLPELIEIGDHARVGTGTIIFAHYVDANSAEGAPQMRQGPVRIGRYATIYTGAIIMPGVSIGDHAIVRAGAVVEDDVPAYGIAAGVPARVVGIRTASGETITGETSSARERATPP